MIGMTKSLLWRLMRSPQGLKFARLVSEEWAQAAHFAAARGCGPQLAEIVGLAVRRGPFARMQYPGHAAVGSTLYPKLLGSYERELHDTLERIVERPYATLVDVGAAEGYYAVGLALRMPDVAVIAFEAHALGRQTLQEMAALNTVAERVQVLGTATCANLAALRPRAPILVICDCEGGEYELLDPAKIAWLRDADILVEVHQMHGLDGRAVLKARFAETHDITAIEVRQRDSSLYPELAGFDPRDREALLFERTDLGGWLWCVARNRVHSSLNAPASAEPLLDRTTA